jgi:hypothetical protein
VEGGRGRIGAYCQAIGSVSKVSRRVLASARRFWLRFDSMNGRILTLQKRSATFHPLSFFAGQKR